MHCSEKSCLLLTHFLTSCSCRLRANNFWLGAKFLLIYFLSFFFAFGILSVKNIFLFIISIATPMLRLRFLWDRSCSRTRFHWSICRRLFRHRMSSLYMLFKHRICWELSLALLKWTYYASRCIFYLLLLLLSLCPKSPLCA